jgi:hypothetical protein
MLRDNLAGLIEPMVDSAGAHHRGGHPNEGLTGGCSRSTELAIVALKRSWRQIFGRKTGRRAEKGKWPGFEVTTEAQDSRSVGTARHKSHRTIDPQCLKKSPPRRGGIYALTENVASPFHAEPRQGNEEAIKALPSFESRIKDNWELLDRFEQEQLRSTDQLPNLDGESLEFEWDFQKAPDGEWYQVIRAGDAEVWRELAFFNNVRRFEEIKEMLRAKYGIRFKRLTPTSASIEWLSGDNLGRALQINYT